MAQMNLSTEQKQSHGHREEICGCQGKGGESGMDCKFGVNRCKPLPLEWLSSEVLLYSTENYIQSLGAEHDARQYEKKNVYVLYAWVTMLYRRK